MVLGSMAINRLRKGERVEVRSDEAGFLGSWYEASLLRKSNKSCWVRYRTLVDASNKPLEECVPLAQVRPVPPALSRAATADGDAVAAAVTAAAFDEGDAVEAYDRDGWWMGTVTRAVQPDKFVVYFRESVEEVEYPASLLRIRQDWHNGIWIRVYEKRNPLLNSYRKQNAQPTFQVRGSGGPKKRLLLASNKEQQQQQQQQNQQEELNDGVPLKSPSDNSSPSSSPQGSGNSGDRRKDAASPARQGRKRKEPDKSAVDHQQKRKKADGNHREAEQEEEEQQQQQETGKNLEEERCMVKYIQRKAYSTVMRALQAKSASLSWAQEKLISDLRMQLGICNDVHIKQLELLQTWKLECECPDCKCRDCRS